MTLDSGNREEWVFEYSSNQVLQGETAKAPVWGLHEYEAKDLCFIGRCCAAGHPHRPDPAGDLWPYVS